MGLHSQLSDVSSESIPIMFICLVAASISTLRSFVVSLVARAPPPVVSPLSDVDLVRTRLAMISDKISDRYSSTSDVEEDCVVCRCGISTGDDVTALPCRHVFHRDCLRGWLRHLNFSCPLCRYQLAEPESRCPIFGAFFK